MFSKHKYIIGFLLIALAQLYVPAKMIYDQEDVLMSGNEFKFKAAPIDPNDPFRGKYITLHFEANSIRVKNINEWLQGEEIFVQIQGDSAGYAKISSVLKQKPQNDDYVKAHIGYVDKVNSKLLINYSFDRFYMEKSKAQPAEDMYRKSITDSTQIAYALVNIKNGEAVIRDVMIDGVSIVERVRSGENK